LQLKKKNENIPVSKQNLNLNLKPVKHTRRLSWMLEEHRRRLSWTLVWSVKNSNTPNAEANGVISLGRGF